jgi:hypothetical protein
MCSGPPGLHSAPKSSGKSPSIRPEGRKGFRKKIELVQFRASPAVSPHPKGTYY